MNAPDSQRFRVRLGEPLSAAKWNGMLDYMDAIIRSVAGPGFYVTQLPTNRIYRASRRGSGASGSATCPFNASIVAGANVSSLEASFALGLIAGIKPRIGPSDSDKFIDDESAPTYRFSIADAIDPATGIGMLYWQLEFNADFSIKKIYPVTLKAVPKKADYKGWKLIGFLINPAGDNTSTPRWAQMLFHNLNHRASQRSGGKALHTFWAVS